MNDERTPIYEMHQEMFFLSCREGRFIIIQELLKVKNINYSINYSDGFSFAVENGHLNIVKILLSECNLTHYENNVAITLASKNGHTDVVRLLLNDERFHPFQDNYYSLRRSVNYAYFDIVKLLLNHPKAKPEVDSNWCISQAYKNGNMNIVMLLWNCNNVRNTLENNNKELYDHLIKIDITPKINNF
jgi:hypothetical protein